MSLAEKFQITVPYKEEITPEDTWTSMGKQRVISDSASCEPDAKFNKMPIGYINQTFYADGGSDDFAKGLGGDTDVSGIDLGVSDHATKGHKRIDMKATDDQYSGEHVDLFYGEAVDEKGNVGFAERNNYLDRI